MVGSVLGCLRRNFWDLCRFGHACPAGLGCCLRSCKNPKLWIKMLVGMPYVRTCNLYSTPKTLLFIKGNVIIRFITELS